MHALPRSDGWGPLWVSVAARPRFVIEPADLLFIYCVCRVFHVYYPMDPSISAQFVVFM